MIMLDSAVYDRLVAALATIEASFWTGSAEDQAKIALCEIADIVPARLFAEDVAGDRQDEARP